MLTWRELSVCATKFGTKGMFCGCTVTTVTCGTDRCGGGASFEQPAATSAARAASQAKGRAEANVRRNIGVPWSLDRPAAGHVCGSAGGREVCPKAARPASERRACPHVDVLGR